METNLLSENYTFNGVQLPKREILLLEEIDQLLNKSDGANCKPL